MRAGSFAILVSLALGGSAAMPAAAQEGASILDLTEQGYLHCNHPNVRARTCRSIDFYEPINEGVYNSTSLIAAGNGVTVEVYTPMWIVDGEFCGTMREQDVMTAVVRLNGREIAPHIAAPALQRVIDDNRKLIDKEFCVRFEPRGADFIGRVMIEGEHWPEFDDPVKLIGPADGYRVAR